MCRGDTEVHLLAFPYFFMKIFKEREVVVLAAVDNLDIEVKASAQGATRSLNNLVSKLSSLESTASKSVTNIRTLAISLNSLSTSMQGLQSINGATFTRITKGISALNSVDASKIRDISNAMTGFSSAMGGLNSVTFNADSLTNLTGALTKLGYKTVGNATTNLNSLKTSLVSFINGLNSAGTLTFDASSLEGLINSLSRLGTKGASNATQNLPTLSAQIQNLIRQLNNIGSLNFDATPLASLANAISMLGRKTSLAATNNLPKLASALKQMMNTLSTAPQVSQNLIQMTNALAQLANQGSKVGSATRSMSSYLNTYSSSARNAAKHSKSLASAIGSLYARFWILLRGFRMLRKTIDISSSLTEVENVVDHTFHNSRQVLDDFTKTSMKDFGLTELAAKQTASRYQAMGNALGITTQQANKVNQSIASISDNYVGTTNGMADMSVGLTKLSADYASFFDVAQSDAAEDFQSIFTGQVKPLTLAA